MLLHEFDQMLIRFTLFNPFNRMMRQCHSWKNMYLSLFHVLHDKFKKTCLGQHLRSQLSQEDCT